jgi:hypothetical protein
MIVAMSTNQGPRRVVQGILQYAAEQIQELIETREPGESLRKHHPQKLSDEEARVLARALFRIATAKERLDYEPEKRDVSLSEICGCESTLRLLARDGITTVFMMWQANPEKVKQTLEISKPLGGRYEIYLYFFVNEDP